MESNLRKAIINLQHEQFEVYSTMAKLENLFWDSFYRCHRGYLVNLGKAQSYDRATITLINGKRVILSTTKYAEFVEAYMRYLKINEG